MNNFKLWVLNFGGEFEGGFNQYDFIKYRLNQCSYLHGGACMTFCILWAISKCDMQTFEQYINSNIGLANIQRFQYTLINKEALVFGGHLFSGYAKEVWRILGIKDLCNYQRGHFLAPELIAKFCTKNTGYTQIHIEAKDFSACHAISTHYDGTSVKFFDPDYGVGVFHKKSDFFAFIRSFFPAYYSDHYDYAGEWVCIRGQL